LASKKKNSKNTLGEYLNWEKGRKFEDLKRWPLLKL